MPLLGARLPLHCSKMFPRLVQSVLHAPTLPLSAPASTHVASGNLTPTTGNSSRPRLKIVPQFLNGSLISSEYPEECLWTGLVLTP